MGIAGSSALLLVSVDNGSSGNVQISNDYAHAPEIIEAVYTLPNSVPLIPTANQVTLDSLQNSLYEFLTIQSCKSSDGTLAFRQPLIALMQYGELGYEAHIPQLGIIEYGDVKEECIANLYEAIEFRWLEYALESDDNLDADALRIADFMRKLIAV